MRIGRKITGGKYHRFRKKKHYEKDNQEKIVTINKMKKKKIRIRGGHMKTILLNADLANIYIPKEKKVKKAKIKRVVETPQNVFLARQNRLMKSAIIETEIGKARITNRPSQEGQVNAILIEEK